MTNPKIILYIIDKLRTTSKKPKRNLIPKDVLYEATNLRYDEDMGGVEKRISRAKYNNASLGSATTMGMHRYYKNSTGSAALLINYSGALKIGYDAQGIFSNLKTGLNQTNIATYLTCKDLCYIFNGEDNNMVFALTSKTSPVEDMGVPSLTSSPSGTTSIATGNLGNGNYYWAVSQQFDGYQEGSVGPSSAATNPNASQVTVAIPTSGNTRCTGYYLYRTKSSSSVLYRLAAVAGVLSNTYIDNIADTSLDTTIIGPIDYDPPGAYKYRCLHQERIFLAGNKTDKSLVVYSDLRSGTSYPDIYPSTNYFYVAKDDGDEITAILNDHLGQLLVIKRNAVALINTATTSDITWQKDDNISVQGCIAPYSAATLPSGCIWLSRYGEQRKRLVFWTGQVVQPIEALEGLEPILSTIPETDLDEIVGHYHNGYYYMAYRTEGLYNDKLLVINTLDWSWSIDTKNVASFCSWNGGDDVGEFYSGASDRTGFIYREDASQFDFLIRKQSELNEGSFSSTATGGTEDSPTLTMDATASSTLAGRSWQSFTAPSDTWQMLSTTFDTWWYTAEWTDRVRQIDAKALAELIWTEIAPSGTSDIIFYLRTGDTVAACEAAAWNGPYTTAGGSNISAVSAAKYIQVRCRMSVQKVGDASSVYLYRSGTTDTDFVIKIAANYGTPVETTIEFDMQSGRIDLGDVNEAYKRLRKRLRSVKIEYEPQSASTGSFTFSWYLNGSTTATNSFVTNFVDNPRTRLYNFPLGTYCDDFWWRFYSNTDNKSLKVKKILFEINVENFTVLK